MTNPEVLAVDQHCAHEHELFTRGDQVAWVAEAPASQDKYLAVFNLDDHSPADVRVQWSELGLKGKCSVRNLWGQKDVGIVDNSFAPMIEPHGAGLYRISPLVN